MRILRDYPAGLPLLPESGHTPVMRTDTHTSAGEKRNAALSSIAAALFLTVMKIAVGISTGSLGILSEAAHSGLDLLAAGVTYFAVRYASAPADPHHPYGHGKMENLSALVETLLLLLTCIYIVREAAVRLFSEHHEVTVAWWSFAVMIVSIGVDATRSRMLKRVAQKHKSQALEADALHFSTDIWSSAVVILGLVCVWAAGKFPVGSAWRSLLERADAVAALGVCAIIVMVSLRLGRAAIDVLLDSDSGGVTANIRKAALGVAGVRGVGQVRARLAGPAAFVDISVEISRETSFEDAHRVGDKVEEAVRSALPGADVMVHMEPVG